MLVIYGNSNLSIHYYRGNVLVIFNIASQLKKSERYKNLLSMAKINGVKVLAFLCDQFKDEKVVNITIL